MSSFISFVYPGLQLQPQWVNKGVRRICMGQENWQCSELACINFYSFFITTARPNCYGIHFVEEEIKSSMFSGHLNIKQRTLCLLVAFTAGHTTCDCFRTRSIIFWGLAPCQLEASLIIWRSSSLDFLDNYEQVTTILIPRQWQSHWDVKWRYEVTQHQWTQSQVFSTMVYEFSPIKANSLQSEGELAIWQCETSVGCTSRLSSTFSRSLSFSSDSIKALMVWGCLQIYSSGEKYSVARSEYSFTLWLCFQLLTYSVCKVYYIRPQNFQIQQSDTLFSPFGHLFLSI